jgi:radical SAM superfamily enzyme YgiQ (UPF0313 family)
MRASVIVAWRPKGFPEWDGRASPPARLVPRGLAFDRAVAPYTGVHLASLLPRHWDVTVIHEMARDVPADLDVDLVFLSTMDFCAPHARRVARALRRHGTSVVAGGLFPTLNPGYFEGSVDSVVIGEAEPVIAAIVADAERGSLQPIYRARKSPPLDDLPAPRYDLVETSFGIPMGYEATRGCPFRCSFCVLSAPGTAVAYRRRPIAQVIRDISAVPSGWSWVQRKYLTFLDNNLGADRAYFRGLCEAMIPLRRLWGTETSIDTITPESARLMGKAGCLFAYIGLESLSDGSLQAANKRHNRVKEYRDRIRLLHDNGVLVMSIFLVGLDEDTPEYLRELPDLVQDVGVDVPVFSLTAPIDGTPFHRDLKESGRLLPGDLLDGMDGVHLLYRPRHLSADQLEMAFYDCMRRAYRPTALLRRVGRRLGSGVWCAAANAACNLFYRGHQRGIVESGLARRAQTAAIPGEECATEAALSRND